MKVLSYWSSRVWQVILDERKSTFQRKFVGWRTSIKNNGWAYKSSQKWFAVFKDKGVLQFRCEGWGCSINKDTSCDLILDSKNIVFVLRDGDKIIFKHEYKKKRLGELLDPTYDEIDAENDDFFLWLFRLWSDPERVKNTVDQLE